MTKNDMTNVRRSAQAQSISSLLENNVLQDLAQNNI